LCELLPPLPLKLPLVIVKQAQITAQAARHWLHQRGIVIRLPNDQRDLYGCLVAHRGHGFISVSDVESPEDQRLTIAHEVAHFLVDYLLPRQQVLHALGAHITGVLNGLSAGTLANVMAVADEVGGAYMPRPGTEGAVAYTHFDTSSSEDHAITILLTKEQMDRLPSQTLVRITSLHDDHTLLTFPLADHGLHAGGLQAHVP
jgi:hypothetical protein